MTLENKHEISIRELKPKDSLAFYEIVQRNRERLIRYFPITVQQSQNEESIKSYLNQEFQIQGKQMIIWGVFLLNELVAVLFIKSIDWRVPKCELGYFIDKTQEGKGISTYAVHMLKKHCFEKLEMNKVFLRIDPGNIASVKIALKCGFKKEGSLRKEFKIETGELVDVDYYGMIKEEYYQ